MNMWLSPLQSFRSTCLCVHSHHGQHGSDPIRGYFLTEMAEGVPRMSGWSEVIIIRVIRCRLATIVALPYIRLYITSRGKVTKDISTARSKTLATYHCYYMYT